MKIDKAVQPISSTSVNDRQSRVDKATSASSNAGKVEQSVHISTHSSQVGNSSDSGAVVDTARVQEIKQAISEGNFKVNSEAVADRLLETVRELIQAKKG